MAQLEIACFDRLSATLALQQNINRIELCDNYEQGGLTPSIDDLRYIKSKTNIPVFVMIRPRGGDFNYTQPEFEMMKSQLVELKNAGADGFVFGILNEDNSINVEQNLALIELADSLPCTFHRAFDRTNNLEASLDVLIQCGFSTVLTSGGSTSAMAGLQQLLKLKKQAANNIEILVGGGVRSTNITDLKIHFNYLHSACITDETNILNEEELRLIVDLIQ